MLNFNSLRQHLSNGLWLAIPVGLAVAVHGVWIGVSGRLHQVRDASVKPAVDNTAQLVRITRRAVQQQQLAAVSLELSSSFPPPPPELLMEGKESLPFELESDCPPMTSDGLKQGNERAEAARPVPSAPEEGISAVSNQGADATRSLPPEAAELPQIWRRSLGVPIWPRQLGENQLQPSSGKSPSKILRAGRSRNSISKPSL